jgi:hypothetical protein
MDAIQIVQIVLIPLITLGLTILWESARDIRKRKLEKDREIYQELREYFEGDIDLVAFFQNHSVGDPTRVECIDQFLRLLEKLKRPGFLFTYDSLEKLRIELLEKLEEFNVLASKNLFVHSKLDGFYELKYSREAEYGMNPETLEKFDRLRKKIDGLGTEIYRTYKKLSDKAQRKL